MAPWRGWPPAGWLRLTRRGAASQARAKPRCSFRKCSRSHVVRRVHAAGARLGFMHALPLTCAAPLAQDLPRLIDGHVALQFFSGARRLRGSCGGSRSPCLGGG